MTENIVSLITGIIAVIGIYLGIRLARYIKSWDKKKTISDGQTDQILLKKRKILAGIVIGIPLGVALFFVILYHIMSDKKFGEFMLYGFISVIVNLILAFILFYFNKDKLLKELNGKLSVSIAYILSLAIPFFLYFVFISLVLSGFKIPFS